MCSDGSRIQVSADSENPGYWMSEFEFQDKEIDQLLAHVTSVKLRDCLDLRFKTAPTGLTEN